MGEVGGGGWGVLKDLAPFSNLSKEGTVKGRTFAFAKVYYALKLCF